MEIKKNAQQHLFRLVSRHDIRAEQHPKYNGYTVEDFGHFKSALDGSYQDFESETSENLMQDKDVLILYFTDLVGTLSKIAASLREYQQEQIFDFFDANQELFRLNQYHSMNRFIVAQQDIIYKTTDFIQEKIKLVANFGLRQIVNSETGEDELFSSRDYDTSSHKKIRFKLSKVNLTVLLWWLAEPGIYEVEKSHKYFVSSVETGFQYWDENTKTYRDMKHIQELMSKLMNGSTEVNPEAARMNLLKILTETTLPPKKSLLDKNKWSKS